MSLQERDRRWAWTRAFLAERDLQCRILFGPKGRERYAGYLSNECADGVEELNDMPTRMWFKN